MTWVKNCCLNGVILPPGQTGDQDLADALDNIFNHPNVGPFRVDSLDPNGLLPVTPSPSYVGRVCKRFSTTMARVFAVISLRWVKAILVDERGAT